MRVLRMEGFVESLFDVASAAVNGGPVSGRETAAYGAVAEQLAIVELLQRGHKVARPVVDDDGVDLVVNYSLRVQVKNSHRQSLEVVSSQRYRYEGFKWSSKRNWLEADVFLLHGQGRRWVVPAFVLGGHGKTLMLYSSAARGRASVVAQYENAWGVFDG